MCATMCRVYNDREGVSTVSRNSPLSFQSQSVDQRRLSARGRPPRRLVHDSHRMPDHRRGATLCWNNCLLALAVASAEMVCCCYSSLVAMPSTHIEPSSWPFVIASGLRPGWAAPCKRDTLDETHEAVWSAQHLQLCCVSCLTCLLYSICIMFCLLASATTKKLVFSVPSTKAQTPLNLIGLARYPSLPLQRPRSMSPTLLW
jgi:hypothetical protein